MMNFDLLAPFAASIAGGYFFGSIPFGLLVGHLFGIGDVRKKGSGNIGSTNLLRNAGLKAGITTLFFDVSKGILPAWICLTQWGSTESALAGIAAVIGHCFPIWLRFRGGKGVAVSFGLLLLWAWPIALVCLSIWATIVFLFRYVSAASMATAILAPVLLFLSPYDTFAWPMDAIACILFLQHRKNISRLINHTENKITLSNK
jgi:glycerol-3-phosphate acyltransferase PlsY